MVTNFKMSKGAFGWHQAHAPEDSSHKAQKKMETEIFALF